MEVCRVIQGGEKMINMLPNEQLRRERQRRGWSRQYVAEQIGVADPKTIGRWERGVAFPSSYFLQKLCTLFGMLAQDLGLYPVEHSNTMHPPATRPESDTLNVSALGGLSGMGSAPIHLASKGGINRVSAVGRKEKATLAGELIYDNHIQQHRSDGILWASLRLRPNVSNLLGRWDSFLAMPAAEI